MRDIARFPRMLSALTELSLAASYAADTDTDIWEFAIEIGELRDLGLSSSDLRWLVARDFVLQAREVDPAGEHRSFQNHHPLRFDTQSCFVLTHRGKEF